VNVSELMYIKINLDYLFVFSHPKYKSVPMITRNSTRNYLEIGKLFEPIL